MEPHYKIKPMQYFVLLPKDLSHEAFAIIAIHRTWHDLFTHDDTEAGNARLVRLTINLELITNNPAFKGKHRRVSVRPFQASRALPAIIGRADQAPRRERPLARRARTTARPPRVFIRTRN